MSAFSSYHRPIAELMPNELVQGMIDTVGLGYHPDTKASEYEPTWRAIDGSSTDMFTPEECKAIDAAHARFAEEGIDLCSLALDLIHESIPPHHEASNDACPFKRHGDPSDCVCPRKGHW